MATIVEKILLESDENLHDVKAIVVNKIQNVRMSPIKKKSEKS